MLEADGRVFECHKTIHDTVWHSELGASLAIMEVPLVYLSLQIMLPILDNILTLCVNRGCADMLRGCSKVSAAESRNTEYFFAVHANAKWLCFL